MSSVSGSQRVARRVQPRSHDSNFQTFLLVSLVIFIFVIPKTRVVLGAPLYFVDGVIFFLIMAVSRKPVYKSSVEKNLIRMAVYYWIFICFSEIRGMLNNSTYLESIYMVFRFAMAISLIFVLPRIVNSKNNVIILLKAIIVASLVTASLAILTSLPPTKGIIESLVFSIKLINPSGSSYSVITAFVESATHADRGKSLVGISTVTCGFLGTIWPFAILASSLKNMFSLVWQRLAWMASILAPMGILATYGRTAWMIVITLGFMLIFFNYAKGRRTFVLMLMLLAWAVVTVGIYSKFFWVDRIVMKTAVTLQSPLTDVSERERFMSWVSPWKHLIDNPIWIFLGEGTAIEYASRRGRVGSALLDRSDMPSHSFFAAAYYNFGMISAFLQLGVFLICFLVIRKRIQFANRYDRSQITMWHSALMSWTALFIWAATGHGMVTDARGMIVEFFLIGTFIAFDQITADARRARIKTQNSRPNTMISRAY